MEKLIIEKDNQLAEQTKKESNKTRYVNENFNDVFREMTSQQALFNQKKKVIPAILWKMQKCLKYEIILKINMRQYRCIPEDIYTRKLVLV